jgi:hypothetical protein
MIFPFPLGFCVAVDIFILLLALHYKANRAADTTLQSAIIVPRVRADIFTSVQMWIVIGISTPCGLRTWSRRLYFASEARRAADFCRP